MDIADIDFSNRTIKVTGKGNKQRVVPFGLPAQRALESVADAMFKATMVDGVYDKDPHKYADAVRYDTLTFTRVLDERLAVMDSTAATLCRDNGLPILVFALGQPANIAKAVKGESVGTLVRE